MQREFFLIFYLCQIYMFYDVRALERHIYKKNVCPFVFLWISLRKCGFGSLRKIPRKVLLILKIIYGCRKYLIASKFFVWCFIITLCTYYDGSHFLNTFFYLKKKVCIGIFFDFWNFHRCTWFRIIEILKDIYKKCCQSACFGFPCVNTS